MFQETFATLFFSVLCGWFGIQRLGRYAASIRNIKLLTAHTDGMAWMGIQSHRLCNNWSGFKINECGLLRTCRPPSPPYHPPHPHTPIGPPSLPYAHWNKCQIEIDMLWRGGATVQRTKGAIAEVWRTASLRSTGCECGCRGQLFTLWPIKIGLCLTEVQWTFCKFPGRNAQFTSANSTITSHW